MSETAKIDTLELNIKTNADRAAKGIENLSSAISHLKESSKGYGSRIKQLSATIEGLAKQVEGIKSTTASNEKLANSLDTVSEGADGASNSLDEVAASAEGAGDGAKKGDKGLKKFFQQLKRIATYRAIRTVLKGITSAFKEGMGNLYQFSNLIDGQFSKSMDNLASSWQYVKNSLGAFLGIIIEAIEPFLVKLMDGFAKVVTVASKFFALLFNQDHYYKATKSATKYAEALNEVKNQLMGFDELNVLNGNGTTANYGSMFELVPLDSAYEMTAELQVNAVNVDIEQAVKNLKGNGEGLKIISALSGALFGAIKGYQFTHSIFGGLAGAYVGFGLGANLYEGIASISEGGGLEKKDIFDMVIGTALDILEVAGLKAALSGSTAGLIVFTLAAVIDFVISDAFAEMADNYSIDFTDVDNTMAGIELSTGSGGGGQSTYFSWGEKLGKKVFNKADKKAYGGTVNTGSLFWAGENGAELVTQVGSKTTVFNEDQLSVRLETANTGVIQAINSMNANLSSVIKNKNTSINVNDVRLATNSQNMRYAR